MLKGDVTVSVGTTERSTCWCPITCAVKRPYNSRLMQLLFSITVFLVSTVQNCKLCACSKCLLPTARFSLGRTGHRELRTHSEHEQTTVWTWKKKGSSRLHNDFIYISVTLSGKQCAKVSTKWSFKISQWVLDTSLLCHQKWMHNQWTLRVWRNASWRSEQKRFSFMKDLVSIFPEPRRGFWILQCALCLLQRLVHWLRITTTLLIVINISAAMKFNSQTCGSVCLSFV